MRVNSPGSDGAVTQTNDASATGTTDASATQPSASNVNVSVRIASPGNSGAVTQTNTATAQTAAATPPVVAPPLDPDAQITNVSTIDQVLGECTGLCPPGPDSSASVLPAALPTSGISTVAQSNPTNVNISVRIGSPGHDQGATQANTASGATATTTGANNVNVVVSLPGTNVVVPTGSDAWTWKWDWTLDTTPDAADAPTDSGSWNWSWTSMPDTTAPAAPVEGHWLWTWNWVGSNGIASSFTHDQPCDCNWVWDWSWSGDAPTAAAPTDTAPIEDTPDAPAITQSNTVSATATAAASFAGTQAADGDAVTQTIAATQLAQADAQAVQSRVGNLSVVTAGVFDGLDQANALAAEADAAVTLTAVQVAAQPSDTAAATQTLAVTQGAHANADAAQVDLANQNLVTSPAPTAAEIGPVSQFSTGAATAAASSSATLEQVALQTDEGTGPQSATLAQSTTLSQLATASAQASQTRVGNASFVEIPADAVSNPALVQRNDLRAAAAALNTTSTRQMTTQASSNDSEIVALELEATQQADVRQSGDASSGQAQTGRQNLAHWNGIVHKPESPAAEQAAAAAAPVPPATWVTSSSTPVVQRVELDAQVPPLPVAPERRIQYVTVVLGAQYAAPPPGQETAASIHAPTVQRETPARPVEATPPHEPAAGAASGGHTPLCLPCEPSTFFGVIGGARQSGSAGAVAVLSRFQLFAPSGAGRVRHDAPALGSPVDIAPDERPG